MQEPHFPGCWVVESRDNTLSAPGIYSLCAVFGKSHMWVNPLLKQVSTTELPELWLCSSFVEGCRALSQGWQMGIAMGRCWLLACPEFQPHWSVSMVISELCLGRHLLWVVFWKVKLKLIAKAWAWGAGLGGWGCCHCKWLCQLGLGSGSSSEVKAQLLQQKGPVESRSWHSRSWHSSWEELPLVKCLERRGVSGADGLTDSSTQARDTAEVPERAAPQRGAV